MDTAADLALFRAERDALAFLGVLSSLYLLFDPPISFRFSAPTSFQRAVPGRRIPMATFKLPFTDAQQKLGL